jgi:hypothetical protein
VVKVDVGNFDRHPDIAELRQRDQGDPGCRGVVAQAGCSTPRAAAAQRKADERDYVYDFFRQVVASSKAGR